jgi:hypothetical protein
LARLQIGDVANPALIRRLGRKILLPQIWRNHGIGVDLRRAWPELPFLLGLQAHFLHQALNPLLIDAMPQSAQLLHDAWRIIVALILLEDPTYNREKAVTSSTRRAWGRLRHA